MNKCQTAIASLLMIGLAGCQQTNPSEEGRDNDNHNPNYQEVKQSVDEPNNNQKNVTSEDIAQHLVKVATKEPQVNDATALVTMGYAVVGIDVDKDLDRQGVDTVKYSVAQAMQHERYGANAVIIADPDSVQQLKEMKNEIQDGRPVAGVLDQLADMVGRLMPQIPSDMIIQGNNQTPNKQNNQQQQPPNNNQGGPQNQSQNQPKAGPGNNNKAPNMKNQMPKQNNRPNMNKQQTPQKPNQMKPNKTKQPSKKDDQI